VWDLGLGSGGFMSTKRRGLFITRFARGVAIPSLWARPTMDDGLPFFDVSFTVLSS